MLKMVLYLKGKSWSLSNNFFSNSKVIPLFRGWLLLFIINGILIQKIYSQTNLIHNPSFEDTVCGVVYSLPCAQYWYIVQITPDHYTTFGTGLPNTTIGFQVPRTGNAFGGEFVL